MFRALKRKNSIDDPLSRPWPPTRTVFRDAFERNLYTQERLIPCTSVPNGCQPFAHSPDGNKGLCHVSFTGEPYAIERRLYGSGTSYGELPIERWMSPVIEFIRTNYHSDVVRLDRWMCNPRLRAGGLGAIPFTQAGTNGRAGISPLARMNPDAVRAARLKRPSGMQPAGSYGDERKLRLKIRYRQLNTPISATS